MTLFPLDTLKTRLQSAQGFWKAGGFRGIYSGLGSAALGSAPTGKTTVTLEVRSHGDSTASKKKAECRGVRGTIASIPTATLWHR